MVGRGRRLAHTDRLSAAWSGEARKYGAGIREAAMDREEEKEPGEAALEQEGEKESGRQERRPSEADDGRRYDRPMRIRRR